MIPRQPRARSGITLTEILIAILIMGIGMISLAVLFPIGLLRLQAAARLSRGAYLGQSAVHDVSTRNLLSGQSFTDPAISPWYGAGVNPWVQDTVSYGGGTSGGAFRPIGPGLPVAYDPLWRYQTAQNASGTGGYYLGAAMEGRFASGIGYVRADPDGGTASAHGLQRLTNFNPKNYAPINPVGPNNPVPDIFVSPEDVIFQDDEAVGQNTTSSSPIVPDLSSLIKDPNTGNPVPSGVPINDWRFTWFFTGQQSDANNTTVYDGEIVICENREFNIESVMGPASGTAVPHVAGETVVEGIFGFSPNVAFNSRGNGLAGFAAAADRTVLLRWPAAMEDPEVKVGSWIADVTYERTSALDNSRMADVLNAAPPGGIPAVTIPRMQRCNWYQVAKKSPADTDALGVAGYRSMTVWTVAPLRAQTLLNPNGTPVHVNAALIMPSVVNVYSRTFYTR